jgi:hypothetical protein
MPNVYHCPNDPSDRRSQPSYLVITGPGTAFPGVKPTKLADITDKPHQTILAIQVEDSGINWLEPSDATVAEFVNGAGTPTGRKFAGDGPEINFALADGSVRPLSNVNSTPQLRKALLTISGGETIDPGQF